MSQSDLCAYGCKVRAENNESGSESLVEDCIKKCFSTRKRLPLTNLDDATKNLPALPANSNIISPDIITQFTTRLNSSKFDWKKIHSIVSEAGNTKVELALSENGSPTNLCSLTFVNKQRQSKSEWGYWLKTLWRKRTGNVSFYVNRVIFHCTLYSITEFRFRLPCIHHGNYLSGSKSGRYN